MNVLKSVIAVRLALYGPPIKRKAQHDTKKWQWLKDKIEVSLECGQK